VVRSHAEAGEENEKKIEMPTLNITSNTYQLAPIENLDSIKRITTRALKPHIRVVHVLNSGKQRIQACSAYDPSSSHHILIQDPRSLRFLYGRRAMLPSLFPAEKECSIAEVVSHSVYGNSKRERVDGPRVGGD
jgi:hypothetical protein